MWTQQEKRSLRSSQPTWNEVGRGIVKTAPQLVGAAMQAKPRSSQGHVRNLGG